MTRPLSATRPSGFVSFVGAGPGDPELLTLKARNRLHDADIVVHDRLVSAQVLELARRDAERVCAGKRGFGPSWPQARINALLVRHARAGKHVVRLKSGDPAVFGRLDEEIEALESAGILLGGRAGNHRRRRCRRGHGGLAHAPRAQLGASPPHGRDVEGFAEHDWAALARPGSVAAIYMGKRAAAFLRGRLLMRGAAPSTPVTIVENASRQDKRIVATTLLGLPDALDEAHLAGPVVLMFGILPRDAMRKAEADFEAHREAV